MKTKITVFALSVIVAVSLVAATAKKVALDDIPGTTELVVNTEEFVSEKIEEAGGVGDMPGARNIIHVTWAPDTEYHAGDYVYAGKYVYRCLLDHTSGSTFVPLPDYWKQKYVYEELDRIEKKIDQTDPPGSQSNPLELPIFVKKNGVKYKYDIIDDEKGIDFVIERVEDPVSE